MWPNPHEISFFVPHVYGPKLLQTAKQQNLR